MPAEAIAAGPALAFSPQAGDWRTVESPAPDEAKAELSSSLADRAEVAMLAMVEAGHPVIEMPLSHGFADGMYIRTIFIPKGTLLTSREHKQQHPFFITSGDILVTSEKEGQVRYVAPYAGITEPGTRRTLYANEDTVWTTVHLNPTNERDPDKIILEITGHNNPLVDTACPVMQAWSKNYDAAAALAKAIGADELLEPSETAESPLIAEPS